MALFLARAEHESEGFIVLEAASRWFFPQRQYDCALRVSDAARAGTGQLAAPPPAAIGGKPAPGARIIDVNEYRIDHPVRKLGTRPTREPSPIRRPVAPGCRRRRIRSRFGRSGSSPRPGRSP